jgi:hypothetical protein
MGNLNHNGLSKAYNTLVSDIKKYIHEDKNTYDYLTNRKSQPEHIEELNIIPSNITDKIKTREICDLSMELVASLFNRKINHEVNISNFHPLLVHKITSIGQSKALSSQLIYIEDAFVNKRLKNKYYKWNIDNDDSTLLEKLCQLSSIHANSVSISSESNNEAAEIKSTKKLSVLKRASSLQKVVKKIRLRQQSKDNKVNTILSHMEDDIKGGQKVLNFLFSAIRVSPHLD